MSENSYTFTNWDEKTSSSEDGHSVAHAAVTFVYSGAITGTGTSNLLMHYRPDGTGTFIGLEQVTGTVDGRQGSFVLSHRGHYGPDGIHDEMAVVAGSATGDLTGWTGTLVADATEGQQEVPYSLTCP
ncbi:hypothetical protein GCM10010174_33290 [Kutzneria viridogrisea]|uniref:DUF3224 domain-containing protein n=2 Tax=Kutzneria TaxID=43356 RepID=W5WNQ9_9PSEU|nr:DUF3224 domain-containing protein [Kutzneria albida]AHI02147.1 hypothetical protein KALB_8790 [Kutzneria albida DSM 43870]MBA8929290.1 hypothetical protein [Kutzneria viridogrisea]